MCFHWQTLKMSNTCAEGDPELERNFHGHRDTVTAVDFHPSTCQVVSSSLDASIMLWNYEQQHRAFR